MCCTTARHCRLWRAHASTRPTRTAPAAPRLPPLPLSWRRGHRLFRPCRPPRPTSAERCRPARLCASAAAVRRPSTTGDCRSLHTLTKCPAEEQYPYTVSSKLSSLQYSLIDTLDCCAKQHFKIASKSTCLAILGTCYELIILPTLWHTSRTHLANQDNIWAAE